MHDIRCPAREGQNPSSNIHNIGIVVCDNCYHNYTVSVFAKQILYSLIALYFAVNYVIASYYVPSHERQISRLLAIQAPEIDFNQSSKSRVATSAGIWQVNKIGTKKEAGYPYDLIRKGLTRIILDD